MRWAVGTHARTQTDTDRCTHTHTRAYTHIHKHANICTKVISSQAGRCMSGLTSVYIPGLVSSTRNCIIYLIF